MLAAIIQDFTEQMKAQSEALENVLSQTLDFNELEQKLSGMVNDFSAAIMQTLLNGLFSKAWFLTNLKQYGGTLGMRFKEYRPITIQLGNGCRVPINSPYFVKAASKRKKTKQKKGDAHLGLSICGFISHVSPCLQSKVVQMAVLCPSYEVAHTILKENGIFVGVKTIRRLCGLCLPNDFALRSQLAFQGDESELLDGKTLVISADGGRIRERKKKRGRRPKAQSQQGYSSEWKEPKLFTIYLLDSEGQLEKTFKPLHDATMGDHEVMFDLLENYLHQLNLEKVARIVFTGDGGTWIWNDAEKLIERLQLDSNKVYQVLDYTHAIQNLNEIIDFVPKDKQKSSRKKWQKLLWKGDIEALKKGIKVVIKDKENCEKALNKWENYFDSNKKRMQYSEFEKKSIPRGSGHVESAIRRVINLRLKAPGSFWLKEMAECFLYLRSQLISGRWTIFMKNLTTLQRLDFINFYQLNHDSSMALKAM